MPQRAGITMGTLIVRAFCIVSWLIHVLAGFGFGLLVFHRLID